MARNLSLRTIGRRALPLLLLLPLAASATKTFESVSPNGKLSVLSRCDDKRENCDVYVHAGKRTVEIGPRGYPSGPGISWVNLDTVEVTFGCGDWCRTSWFYNTRMGTSAGYKNVLAVDGIRMRVAVSNAARQEIEIVPIRAAENAEPTCRIRREWKTGTMLDVGKGAAIDSIVFRSIGALKLSYRHGATGEHVAEEIAIASDGSC